MERLDERRWSNQNNTRPTVELKACAHCGASGELHFQGRKVQVICMKCRMQTPLFDFQTQAIALWNKRVE